MKTLRIEAIALTVIFLAALPALARVCPVTDRPAVNDYSTTYNGERVYFSCKLAMEAFKENPTKYLEGLKHVNDDQRKPVKQTMCPVSGEKVDRSVWSDYNGKRVYLHCELSKKMFESDPEKYFKKMLESDVALDDAPELDTRFIGASEGIRNVN